MTRDDFQASLERALQLRGWPFDHWNLVVFVESGWPAIEETADDVKAWADEFLGSQLATG